MGNKYGVLNFIIILTFIIRQKNTKSSFGLKHANIAHRGLHTDTISENSMSAFENAPEIARGQLSESYSDADHVPDYRRFLLKNLLINFKNKPAFIAYEIDSLPKGFIESQRYSTRMDSVFNRWV